MGLACIFCRLAALLLSGIVLYVPTTAALSSYNTNCTLPPANATEDFYFVSTPNVRGSLQIVWLCLTTLIVCVYKVLHFNVVPEQRFRFLKSLGWSVVAVLAPEYVLCVGIYQRRLAQERLRELHAIVPEDCRSRWTLTHMFFANASGFVLSRGEDRVTLDGEVLISAIKQGLLGHEPTVTREQIMDKSKDDSFTKGLALIQIIYFYVEFFARIGQRLAISELELSVASIGVYSIVSYLCLWCKPKDVKTTIMLFSEELAANRKLQFREAASEYEDDTEPPFRPPPVSSHETNETEPSSQTLLPDNITAQDHDLPKLSSVLPVFYANGDDSVLVCITGLPLGAVHAAAWNFTFPSYADMWLWRVACLVCMASALALLVLIWLVNHFDWDGDFEPLVYVLVFLYAVGRTILIVETIRCLFFLPASAFQATSWAMSIPHLG